MLYGDRKADVAQAQKAQSVTCCTMITMSDKPAASTLARAICSAGKAGEQALIRRGGTGNACVVAGTTVPYNQTGTRKAGRVYPGGDAQ